MFFCDFLMVFAGFSMVFYFDLFELYKALPFFGVLLDAWEMFWFHGCCSGFCLGLPIC